MACSCSKVIKNVVKGVAVSIPKAIASGNAPSDVIDNRRNICAGCPSNKNGICSECSCVILLKTVFNGSDCPLKKWE